MEKQKISVKMHLPYEEAVSYLEDLLKSLKAGTVVVESGGDHVTMKPAGNVAVEIEAKVKKDKQKFGLEIEWTDAAPGDLTISDTEPAPVPAEAAETAPVPAEPAKVPAKATPAKTPAKQPAKKNPAKRTAGKKAAKPAKKKAAAGNKPDAAK